MKKILSIILAILMVVSIVPFTASAATYTGTCGDNVTWTYDSSIYTLTISGIGAIYDYESNNRPWENYEDNIKTVVINDGVTTIGARAFYDCGKLVTVTLADSIITIGRAAFNLCKKLTEITIPDSVTEIGEYAFAGCDGLTEIIIPDSVTTIGKHAFSGCDGLISVTIGNGVTTIGNSAFNSCDGLTTITIPKNVATIGSSAFANCENLTSIMVDNDNQYFVYDEYGILFNKDKTTLMQYPIGHTRTSYTIPDGVTTIEEMAFYNCSALTNITFPNGVETIKYCAFDGCANITSIILPDGVTTIDSWAFGSCSSLKSITIPESVTRISSNAISYNTTIIYYGGTANQWKQLLANNLASEGGYLEENIVFCADQMLLPSGACGDNLTWSYNMLTGVLRISGAGDMYNYGTHHLSLTNTPWSTFLNDIKEVVIEDGVTSIGTYAFYGCSNLSDVKIGDGVTTIGERAFEYCRGLNTVTIGNGVTTIEKYAFKECTGLTSVIIPVSVTDMDSGAFYKCSGITDVYYEGTEEQWIDNIILFSPDNALIGVKIPFNKDVTIHFNYHIHKYNSVVSEPTCTEQGYTTYTCECGESYIDNYVDATGHSYDSVVTQPTCTEKGYTTYTCECGDSFIADYVDATGHNYVDNVCTGCGDTIFINGWQLEDGKWAYYVNNEKLTNKWIKDSVDWCYLGADGYCVTNTWKADSKGWCYIGEDCRIIYNQWLNDNGKWYFIDADGYMLSSQWKKDSVDWVYLGSNGAMLTNAWAKDSQGWCYVGADGYWVKSQWIEYNNNWYYIDANGYMVIGTVKIGPVTHKFASNGVWIG